MIHIKQEVQAHGDSQALPEQKQRKTGRYIAVARGRKPGVYDDWTEAQKQIGSFEGYDYMSFDDLRSAIEYLHTCGLPEDAIRLFRKTFKQLPGFTPDPSAPFKDEFDRFASSQGLTAHVQRKARVDAIRDEIIQYFLPNGVRISADQDEDDGYVHLDDDQRLHILQGMCRKARKPVHPSVGGSLIELKQRPFVNILDFVDTYRTGQQVCTFYAWEDFKSYTNKGRKVDLQMARQNEFLAPLLQNLGKGPCTPGELRAMQRRKPKSAPRLSERQPNYGNSPQACKQEHSSIPDLPRELSPSLSDTDWTLSRSPSPVPDHQRPPLADAGDTEDRDLLHSWPTTTLSSSPSTKPLCSTPKTTFSEPIIHDDADFDDPEVDDPEFQHILLTQEESITSSMNNFPGYGEETSSLGRSALGELPEAAVNTKHSTFRQEFDDPEFDDPDFQQILLTQEENIIFSSRKRKPSDFSGKVEVKKKRSGAAKDDALNS